MVFSTDDLPPALSEEARLRLLRDALANCVGSGDFTPFARYAAFSALGVPRVGEVILGRSSGAMRTSIRTRQQALASVSIITISAL